MKKLTLILLAVAISAMAFGWDAYVDGIYYNLNTEQKTAAVTYKEKKNDFYPSDTYTGALEIPSEITYKGTTYRVTAIGESAFKYCTNLVSVNIPQSVTSIENKAFLSTSLTSITIPSSVTKIAEWAIAGTFLTHVIIPNSVTSIGSNAFSGCANLTTVVIPKSVTKIENDVFQFNHRLHKVYISSSSPIEHIDGVKDVLLIRVPDDQLMSYEPYDEAEDLPVKPKIGKSKVDTDIPVTGAANPNTFVVIIANEDYKNVASVPFAKNDGAVFQKYCQKTMGIPATNIHFVENATFNDIRIQLAWLGDVCDAFEGKSSVIVYYAGHGIPDEASKSAYLLPVDGDCRYVQSAYKLDDFYRKLGSMNAQVVTVFMDACFSGSAREDKMLTSTRGVAIKALSGVPQGKTVVFSAAQGDETAYPIRDEQHGMFTYFLLKKLQETQGDVTLLDLGDYITTNVRQQSVVMNGKPQTPCVTPSASLGNDWQNWKLK